MFSKRCKSPCDTDRFNMNLNFLLIAVVFSLIPLGTVNATENEKFAVVYPEVKGRFSAVIEQIIEGVDRASSTATLKYKLTKEHSESRLSTWLKEEAPSAVIAIGKLSAKELAKIELAQPVVVGAVLNFNEQMSEFSGLSLTPHPRSLFERMLQLRKSIKRVNVVYKEENYGWLMQIAKREAEQLGLEINMISVRNPREAAKKHRDLLDSMKRDVDALWLLQDNETVNDRSVLPVILDKAWRNLIFVFSSKPSHVKRGVVFSLYPDNVRMGEELYELAKKKAGVSNGVYLDAVTQLKWVVNVRTTGHLGFHVPAQLKREIDVMLPKK